MLFGGTSGGVNCEVRRNGPAASVNIVAAQPYRLRILVKLFEKVWTPHILTKYWIRLTIIYVLKVDLPSFVFIAALSRQARLRDANGNEFKKFVYFGSELNV